MPKSEKVTVFQVITPQITLSCRTCTDPKTGKKGVCIYDISTREASLTLPSELRRLPVISLELDGLKAAECRNVKELHLPGTLSSFFWSRTIFPQLERVEVEPGGDFASADDMIFTADYSVLCYVSPRYALQNLVVPETVTRIQDEVLSGIPFKNIVFQNPGVEQGKVSNPIGEYFEGQAAQFDKDALVKLRKDIDLLEIPSGVKKIRKDALGEHTFTRLRAPFLPTENDLGPRAKDIHAALTEFELTDPDYDLFLDDLREYGGLERILVSAPESRYETEDGVLYDKKRKRLLFYPRAKKDASYAVREGTRSIAPFAFHGCRHLVNLTMPDSVTEVGESAICSCPSLESVYLSNEIRILPDYSEYSGHCGVLSNNHKLSSLHLPEKVLCIGVDCIFETPVSRITLPEGLLYLSPYALASSELKEVSLPRSLRMAERGALAYARQVTAYEGTAKGLVLALNAQLKGNLAYTQWTSCWITVLGEDGKRKGFFYIPKDYRDVRTAELLALAWDAPSIDYDLYLEAYERMKNGKDKLLMGFILLLCGGKEELRPAVKKSSKKLCQILIAHGDLLFFRDFLDQDLLSKPSAAALLAECNAKDDPGFAAYLMEYREKHVKKRSFSRFDL